MLTPLLIRYLRTGRTRLDVLFLLLLLSLPSLNLRIHALFDEFCVVLHLHVAAPKGKPDQSRNCQQTCRYAPAVSA